MLRGIRVAQNTKKYENQKCPPFLWIYGPNREENSKRLHSFDQNLARSLKVIFVFETSIYVLPTIVIASMLKPLGSWKSFHSSGNLILIYFDYRQVSVGSIFSEIRSFICSQFVTFSVTSLSLRMAMGWPKLPSIFCLFIYHFEITNKKIMEKSKYFIDPFFHNSTKSTLHIFHLKDKLPSRSIFSQFSKFNIFFFHVWKRFQNCWRILL